MKTLLLTAGLGTRLRPHTLTIPKPLIPFMGLPICYYSLYLLKQIQCTQIISNLHFLPEKIKKQFSSPDLSHFNFQFSHEKDALLGSGGAIKYAEPYLKDKAPFFVINGDEILIPQSTDILSQLRREHIKSPALATLLLTPHPELLKTLKPVWVNKDGFIKGFGDHKASDEDLMPYHYTGYKIFNQEIFNFLPEGESNIFYDVLINEIKKGVPVKAFIQECQWWETGNFDSFIKATKDVIRGMSRNPKNNYIRDVRNFYNQSNNFKTRISGENTFYTHSEVIIKNINMKGTIFINEKSSINDGLNLENVIVNKNSILTSSQTSTMTF